MSGKSQDMLCCICCLSHKQKCSMQTIMCRHQVVTRFIQIYICIYSPPPSLYRFSGADSMLQACIKFAKCKSRSKLCWRQIAQLATLPLQPAPVCAPLRQANMATPAWRQRGTISGPNAREVLRQQGCRPRCASVWAPQMAAPPAHFFSAYLPKPRPCSSG